MTTTSKSMRITPLVEKDLEELEKICSNLEIEIETGDIESDLIDKINKSEKYQNTTESQVNGVGTDENGVRTHPKFGKYVKVIVNHRLTHNIGAGIFVSINLYTNEFAAGDEVEIPIQIARHLKYNCTHQEHYYDKTAKSANGQMGAHLTKAVPKYTVEMVSDGI